MENISLKTCSVCNIEKDDSEFYTRTTKCKTCHKKAVTERRRAAGYKQIPRRTGTFNCKGCDVTMTLNGSTQLYCSMECSRQNRVQTKYPCGDCGKRIVFGKRLQREVVCYSCRKQRRDDNDQRRKERIEEQKAAARTRRKRQNRNRLVRHVTRLWDARFCRSQQTAWEKKCLSMYRASKGRHPSPPKTKKPQEVYDECRCCRVSDVTAPNGKQCQRCYQASVLMQRGGTEWGRSLITKTWKARKYRYDTPWKQWANNKSSNSRKRIRRKYHRKRLRGINRKATIQMCFEWY